ncbi:MAG: WbqC family protein [Chitinophagaceae bacterium]
MKAGIMQPYFFPYIGYFQLINAVDKFIILDEVNYIKKGWINRNYIEIAGASFLFTLPISKASQNTLISDCTIDSSSSWKHRFLKTLSLGYAKAPYFKPVFPIIEAILLHQEVNLVRFLEHSLKQLCDFLQIRTVIIPGTACYNNLHLRGQDRIVDICQQEGAEVYINPAGGVDLYNKNLFKLKHIELQFLRTHPVPADGVAKPPFSIIHLMMHHSREKITLMLGQFDLQ